MRIVVDARHLDKISGTETFTYLQQLLQQLIASQPAHQFMLIAPAGFAGHAPNSSYLPLPDGKNYLGMRRWYRSKLPELLQEQKANLLIGLNTLPAKTSLPQVIFITALPAITQKPTGLFSFHYRQYWPKQLSLANAIATINPVQQQQVARAANLEPEKIQPIGYVATPGYQPVSWQQREEVMEKYTGGKEYFLYTGPFTSTRFLLVLKAFSLFKKRQLSSMQLVAAGHFEPNRDLQEKLATYKYRHDVQLLPQANESQLAELTSSAYAFINLLENEPVAFGTAKAVQCHIPVIGLETNLALQQAAAGAALVAAATPEAVAEQMKQVYKNENLRQQLVAYAQSAAYAMENGQAAANFWQIVQQFAAQNDPTFAAAPDKPVA